MGERLISSSFFLTLNLSIYFLLKNFYGIDGQIISMYLILAILLVRKRRAPLTDPRLLLSGFIVFYSTFFPISAYYFGVSLFPIKESLISSNIKLSFIFFISCLFVFDLSLAMNKDFRFNYFSSIASKKSFKFLLSFICILVLLLCIFILTSGATSKQEAIEKAGVVGGILYFGSLILVTALTIRWVSLSKVINDKKDILIISLMIFYVLVTGERDVIFRVAVIAALVIFELRYKPNPLVPVFILLSAALIIPVSQSFKAILLAGGLDIPSLSFELMFSNEFISAGRNLYALQFYGVEHSFSYLFSDFIRAFFPASLMSDASVMSTGAWFNNYFRTLNGHAPNSGWGFGLVAQGYLLGKELGVVVVAVLYSIIISIFFNLRYKSIYYYVFYVLMLLTAIYCLRADLANFLSQSFKITIFTLFVILSVRQIMKRKYK